MPIFLLIFFLLLLAYAVLINYYHQAWYKLPVYQPPATRPDTAISVIIPMRNEAENIPALLDSLEQQDYPAQLVELVLVDDHSTDSTASLLEAAANRSGRIKAISLEQWLQQTGDSRAFKKKAIEAGVHHATGTLIVTTDADCRFHPQWLSTLAAFQASTNAAFIAAPVRIIPKGSLVSLFQTLDFLTLQGITAAAVSKRAHSMCNGANLAYLKQVFQEVGGFANIDQLPSGDDMFLMHKIYTRYPERVFYLKSPSAIVDTAPVESWKAFFNQRIRWASKADSYDDKRIFWVLLLVYLINVAFLALAVTAFFKGLWAFFFGLLLLAKLLIEFPFVHTVAIFFGQQRLMRYFPFFQPLHIGYTIIAGWLGKFGKYEWKGRTITKSTT
ncbi:MAG: glycosyltransferase [Candidatus Pseudobacter hemicellulosilyticus]|uniref:Glycosyltransferase n=1 Tax=Candidatus Pseudobacter hemicellulosilyticus TaxID=3121375 RepID=A0AAJ5WWB4_9BACT|nr:MAG: glycosyltransferase [Pseudobacter sp.]